MLLSSCQQDLIGSFDWLSGNLLLDLIVQVLEHFIVLHLQRHVCHAYKDAFGPIVLNFCLSKSVKTCIFKLK